MASKKNAETLQAEIAFLEERQKLEQDSLKNQELSIKILKTRAKLTEKMATDGTADAESIQKLAESLKDINDQLKEKTKELKKQNAELAAQEKKLQKNKEFYKDILNLVLSQTSAAIGLSGVYTKIKSGLSAWKAVSFEILDTNLKLLDTVIKTNQDYSKLTGQAAEFAYSFGYGLASAGIGY